MTTCLFPIQGHTTGDRGSGTVNVQLPSKHALVLFCEMHHVTVEQLIHAAWALVLCRYVGSDVIAFILLPSTPTAGSLTLFTSSMEESAPFLHYLNNIESYYQPTTVLKERLAATVNTGVLCHHGGNSKRRISSQVCDFEVFCFLLDVR